MQQRAMRKLHRPGRAKSRLGLDTVSRVIAQIGEEAKVVVRQPDKATGRRIKYASAHDLRRSCAERLINAGVSAETLMVIMRHRDFATTRKFYGAKRAAPLLETGGAADCTARPPRRIRRHRPPCLAHRQCKKRDYVGG